MYTLDNTNQGEKMSLKIRAAELWQQIINAGVDTHSQGNKRKKIRLTNKMAISLAIISFPFSICFYELGCKYASVGVFAGVCFFLSSIYLNHKKHYNLSRFMIIASVNIGVIPYVYLFGPTSGIQYTYLPFSCIPFVLFELKEWKYIFVCVLVSIFLFIEPHYNWFSLPDFPVEPILASKIFFPIMLVSFAVIVFNIYYMSRESELAEDSIMKVKRNFELQIKDAKEVLGEDYEANDSIAEILNAQISDLRKSEEELKKSNSQLQTINNDLDNFIYTASHDLRSPIANIEGLINVLVSHENYEKKAVKEIVDMMSLSVSKFKDTISELVEISRIEKDGQAEAEEVLFAELLEDVKFSINELIKVSHANIISDFSAATTIKFSKKNLRSIFYNLISNAIKYKALDRAPEVCVSTWLDNNYVVLQIEDNGLGISEENFPKIFSMFKRVHDHVEGSGVGLYIVKKIMEHSNGSITVESIVGMGSKFRLYFRRV